MWRGDNDPPKEGELASIVMKLFHLPCHQDSRLGALKSKLCDFGGEIMVFNMVQYK